MRATFLPDDLARSLSRFQNAQPRRAKALALFTEGMKLLEVPNEVGYLAYDKKIRQAAAVALRTGRAAGCTPARSCALKSEGGCRYEADLARTFLFWGWTS